MCWTNESRQAEALLSMTSGTLAMSSARKVVGVLEGASWTLVSSERTLTTREECEPSWVIVFLWRGGTRSRICQARWKRKRFVQTRDAGILICVEDTGETEDDEEIFPDLRIIRNKEESGVMSDKLRTHFFTPLKPELSDFRTVQREIM